jgi:hypothetical protein
MSWVDRTASLVAEVIRRVRRNDLTALREALAEAYPWGRKSGIAYKAWLKEIRRQLGHRLNRPNAAPTNRQIELFEVGMFR